MNGAVCKDRLFAERKGVLGPVTDEIIFQRIGGPFKNDGVDTGDASCCCII